MITNITTSYTICEQLKKKKNKYYGYDALYRIPTTKGLLWIENKT